MTQQQIDDITTGLTAMSAGMAKLATAFAGVTPTASELLNEEALQNAIIDTINNSLRVDCAIKGAVADQLIGCLVNHLRHNDAVRSEIQDIVQGELDNCERFTTAYDVEQIIDGYEILDRDAVEEIIDEKAPDWTELKSALRNLADTL